MQAHSLRDHPGQVLIGKRVAGHSREGQMRRVLLAITAFAAVSAWADCALAFNRIKLDYRGYFSGIAGAAETNGTLADEDGMVSRSSTALRFKASTLLDSGIQIAFNTSLGLDGVDTLLPNRGHIDEVYLEFGTFFGKFLVGRQDGVGVLMRVHTPTPLYRVYTENTEIDALELANVYTKLDLSGFNSKLTYMTPRIAGFQLGASYLVETTQSGAPVHATTGYDRRKSGGGQATEAGLNYSGKVGDIRLGAAVTYYADNHDAVGERDPSGYDFGLEFGLDGWTLGGNYTSGSNIDHATLYSNSTKTKIWSAGVTYGNGPWQLGGAYAHGADDPAGGNNDVNYQSYVLGFTYLFRPGITLGLGVQHDEADPDTLGVVKPTGGLAIAPGQSVDGNAVFVETGLKF
jgi:predicted porin